MALAPATVVAPAVEPIVAQLGPLSPATGLAVGLVVGLAAGLVATRSLSDGGTDLAAELANELGVRPSADAVAAAVADLTASVDSLVRTAQREGIVDRNQSRSRAVAAVERQLAAEAGGARGGTGTASTTGDGSRGGGGGARSGGGPTSGGGGTVPAVAADLRAERALSAPEATELASVLADGDGSRTRVRSALGDAIDALEAAHGVEQAVQRAGDLRTERQARSLDDRLRELDGSLPATLRPVSSRLLELQADRDDRDGEARSVLSTVCSAAEREVDADLPDGDAITRGRELARQFRSGASDDPDGEVGRIATEVEATRSVDSAAARRLLDALSSPADGETVRAALETAVGALDEHGAVMTTVDVSSTDARQRLDRVRAELDADGPVDAVLAERMDDLATELDRAGDNPAVAYAVHREAEYYGGRFRRRVADERGRGRDGGGDRPDELLADVADRIEAVREYYDRRPDHNHSIPRHFLTLAESLHEDADRIAVRSPERARGSLEATADLVDRVEELYERNEYSVMLRRLRG